MKKEKTVDITVEGLSGVGEFGKSYNLLFGVGDLKRKLLTFKVLTDGSLIIIKKIPFLTPSYRHKTIIPARKAIRTLKKKDMEVEELLSSSVPGKMTFHPSGVVNTNNQGRVIRPSLRTMDITQQLCTIIYPHLAELPDKPDVGLRDLVATGSISEDTHLMVQVLVSPPSSVIAEKFMGASTLTFLEVVYEGQDIQHSEKRLVFHFVISASVRSKDPKASYAFMITLPDNLVPPVLRPNGSRS